MNTKSILFLIILLFNPTTSFLSAQPVVKVPASCNVVIAGTGAGVATGPGGNVGNGGIVCMPDPFDIATNAGNFSEITGITINSWQLLGDISVQTTNVPPASPIQSAGTISVVNLQSYNKNLRTSESLAPSLSTLARSKGKVRIYYKGSCENFIEFEVLKSYKGGGSGTDYVPPILGASCILPNTTYTFSVDQIASDNYADNLGGDNYYWTLPFGIPLSNANYLSTDKSAVTFTTPAVLTGSNVISCCYGRCNPWDANTATPTTCMSKTLTVNPGSTTLSLPLCINTGQGNIAVTSSVAAKWQCALPWTFSFPSPAITSSNALNFNGDNNPGNIIINTPAGNCPERYDVYQVNRIYKSPSVALTHNATGCLNAGGTYTLSVGPNALNNATTWRFPAGLVAAGIVTTTTTSAITNFTILPGAPAGMYIIRALSTACPTDSIPDTIYVKPATPVISGPSPACIVRGSTGITSISCAAVPGATSYTWNLGSAPGWSCTANCTTNTPTLACNGVGLNAGPVNISVTANSAGGCSTTSANFTVNYSPITPNSITASCWNTNGTATGTTVISVANAPSPFFGSYTVTCVPAGLYTSYAVNAQGGIVLSGVNATAGTVYTFTITHTTVSCGNSAAAVLPLTATSISGNVLSILSPGIGNSDVYYVNAPPPAPSYQWFVNGGATGGTGSSQTLSGNAAPPITVCVNITSSPIVLGTTSVCRKPQECCTGACTLGTHSLRTANGAAANGIKGVSVYPNPNNGEFTITIPDFNTSATAILIDIQGKEVGNYQLEKGENAIITSGLAKGLYNILLLIDDKSDSRKIEIK